MEALATVAVVSSIVQLVDFSIKLLSDGVEMHKSADGALSGNALVEQVTMDLVALDEGLKRSIQTPGQTLCLSEDEAALQVLAEKSKEISMELLTRLGGLKLSDKRSAWETVRKTIKGMRGKAKTDAMVQNIDYIKKQLDSRLLVSIRYGLIPFQVLHLLIIIQSRHTLASVSFEQTEGYLRLDRKTSEIVDAISKGHSCFDGRFEASSIQLKQLHKQTQNLNIELHDKTRAEIADLIIRNSAPDRRNSDAEDPLLKNYKAMHASLAFPTIHDRYHEVAEAHQRTYEWIFRKPPGGKHSWSDFGLWLHEGSGIYWINGKPGSGKSTLMKYVYDSERFHDGLKVWSGEIPLVTASFFSWNSGSELQKSLDGLLRSLLHQVLEQSPDLIPIMFDAEVLNKPSHGQAADGKWPIKRLQSLFDRLLTQNDISLRLVIFVDGLDELRGDLDVVVDVLKLAAQSSHVKLCLASRPWVIFEDAFEGCLDLKLHHLTQNDIRSYVQDKLNNNLLVRRSTEEQPSETEDLVGEVVERASGVFLWVKIVVRSLLESLRNRDTASDLRERLKLLPIDIEDLYDNMLKQVDSFYHPQASRLLQIVLKAEGSLSAIQLLFADENLDQAIKAPVNRMSKIQTTNAVSGLKRWLSSRCAGLLEIEDSVKWEQMVYIRPGDTRDDEREPEVAKVAKVNFMHRTVTDYLNRTKTWHELQRRAEGTNFDANISLLSSCLLLLKRGYRSVPFQRQRCIVDACIAHAQAVEKTGKNGYIRFLDELDKTLRYIWRSEDPQRTFWKQKIFPCNAAPFYHRESAEPYYLIEPAEPKIIRSFHGFSIECEENPHCGLDSPDSFLALAAHHGLQGYLEAKLPLIRHNDNKDLIHRMLAFAMHPDRLVNAGWHSDIVKLLLNNNGDPDLPIDGWSPFDRLLFFAYRWSNEWKEVYSISRNEMDRYEPGSYSASDARCESWIAWLDTYQLLVAHGIDTSRIFDEHDRVWNCALHSNLRFMGIFPARLLDEMRECGMLDHYSEELKEQALAAQGAVHRRGRTMNGYSWHSLY